MLKPPSLVLGLDYIADCYGSNPLLHLLLTINPPASLCLHHIIMKK